MGRSPCCDRSKVKRGAWSPEEDATLKNYLQKHGTGGNWIALPQKAGLQRCGKSCRLRWLNYLRPDIKHGAFTQGEENIICNLYNTIGSRWSVIASYLPGRTDNDVKNYWNTKLKKKLMAENCKPPTIRNMKTSTAAAATPAAASTATSSEIGDRSVNYQAFTGSMALPTYFPVPFCCDNTMGLLNAKAKSVSYDPVSIAFPSFILEGSSDSQSHQDSDPFKPFSLGMDENCDIKGVPMDGYTHEILTGFWSQEEEALGADGNADLFSIFHVDSMSQ